MSDHFERIWGGLALAPLMFVLLCLGSRGYGANSNSPSGGVQREARIEDCPLAGPEDRSYWSRKLQGCLDRPDIAKIRITEGLYFMAGVELKSNKEIIGDGDRTRICQDTTLPSGDPINMVFYADSGSEKSHVSNVTLRDLRIENCSVEGFSEHKHMVYVAGVKNFAVKGSSFIGFRGDAICLGGSALGDGSPDAPRRTNESVFIQNNTFDGQNKITGTAYQNRNAVSIVSGVNIFIDDNTFTMTSSESMPGPVDIEPDWSWQKIENIFVRSNWFYRNGGNVGTIALVLIDHGQGVPYAKNVQFTWNRLEANNMPIFVGRWSQADDSTPSHEIKIAWNFFDNNAGIINGFGVRNISIDNNWRNYSYPKPSQIEPYRCIDAWTWDNVFNADELKFFCGGGP